MNEKINQYLTSIENERNIKILLACETGSRAWGFPSPDSDYDIRIIYIHQKDWYFSLSEQKDSLEMMFENNDIDITGWDLRKSLRLLAKSNPPLLERIQSPIIYQADDDFLIEMNTVARSQYSRIATIHHYLSMAKKCTAEVTNSETYKLKKFFYALRSAVACKWILDRQDIPPIAFQKMLDGLEIDKQLLERIAELIALKATINESYMHHGEVELIAFIQDCIDQAEAQRHALSANKTDLTALNDFFLKTLSRYDRVYDH